MASGDYTQPPSVSGGLRSLEADFLAYNQPADPYGTQGPVSYSGIRNFESDFPPVGQRSVAAEPYVPPQSQSNVRPVVNSFTGGDGNRATVVYGAPPPDVDAAGHVNTSEIGLNVGGGYEQPPTQSTMFPQNQSNPGVSTDTPAYDQPANVAFSIPGRHYQSGNLMDPYNYYGMN